MTPKRKRCSELEQLPAELAKRNCKGNNNTTTALGTIQSVPLPLCPNLGRAVDNADPFNWLGDDVIVSILSRLSSIETVRTSVLSRRWRNLWTAAIGSKVVFSYPTKDKDLTMSFSRLRPILAGGVNRIMEFVKPKLDELIVCFDFNSFVTYQAVNNWVQIALANKVARLHLDFSSPLVSISRRNYTFPDIQSVEYPRIHNLTDVCFKYINVSKEVIECMLSNCPSLERLAVWGSSFKQRIRVCPQSSKLKGLEFVDCKYDMIEISSPNLTYLRYNGVYHCLQLRNVPLLSELSIGSSCSGSFLISGARVYIKCIPQLKKLKLYLDYLVISHTIYYPLQFPELKRLEQLEVKLSPYPHTSLLWLIILIKSAPFLQKFSIKLHREDGYSDCHPDKQTYLKNLMNVIQQVHHPCLKSIEMLNFGGCSSQMELGEHLLRISPSLEQFVVSQFYVGSKNIPRNLYNSPVPIEKYRMQAQKFKKWLPPTAKLVIL